MKKAEYYWNLIDNDVDINWSDILELEEILHTKRIKALEIKEEKKFTISEIMLLIDTIFRKE